MCFIVITLPSENLDSLQQMNNVYFTVIIVDTQLKLIIIFLKHEVLKSCIFKACFLVNEEVMLTKLSWFFKDV